MVTNNNEKMQELTVEEKLQNLYELQRIDTEIDKIKTLRGELPLEVQDLEDEIAGLETRIENLKVELGELDKTASTRKMDMKKHNCISTDCLYHIQSTVSHKNYSFLYRTLIPEI